MGRIKLFLLTLLCVGYTQAQNFDFTCAPVVDYYEGTPFITFDPPMLNGADIEAYNIFTQNVSGIPTVWYSLRSLNGFPTFSNSPGTERVGGHTLPNVIGRYENVLSTPTITGVFEYADVTLHPALEWNVETREDNRGYGANAAVVCHDRHELLPDGYSVFVYTTSDPSLASNPNTEGWTEWGKSRDSDCSDSGIQWFTESSCATRWVRLDLRDSNGNSVHYTEAREVRFGGDGSCQVLD